MPSLTEVTLFNYCERDHHANFWGEPLNAITNAGFVIAGLWGLYLLLRKPVAERSAWHYVFVANLIVIGVGSFLFHTIPNTTTELADVIPIGIFMLSYLFFAVQRFVGLPLVGAFAAIGAFIGASVLVGLAPELNRAVNGSLGYGPALLSLWLISAWLWVKGRPETRLIFGASVVFIVSITLRSLDFTLCDEIALGDYKIGTHFLWHTLNAVTLFLLLYAAIRHGGARAGEVIPPKPKPMPPVYDVSL